jgi:hypothetical protein
VVPLSQKSAIAEDGGALITHEAIVLEFNFSPFSDSQLITAAQVLLRRVLPLSCAGWVRADLPNSCWRRPRYASSFKLLFIRHVGLGVTQAEALVTIPASTKRLMIAEYAFSQLRHYRLPR